MGAKLKDLPDGAPLRVKTPEGVKDAVFGHLDGMYSYCYLVEPRVDVHGYERRATFHLSRNTPLKLVDCRWEITDEE